MKFFEKLMKKFKKKNKNGVEYTGSIDIAIPDMMGIEDINGRLIRFICCNSVSKISTHYGMDLWAGFVAFKNNAQEQLTKSDWIPVCFELQHPGKKLTTYSKRFFMQNELFNMLKKIGMELNINKVSREHFNYLGRVFVTEDRLIVAMNEPPKPNIYGDLDKLDNQLSTRGVPEPKITNSVSQEEINAVLGQNEKMADIAKGEESSPFDKNKAVEGVTRASEDVEEIGEIVNPNANTMEPYYKRELTVEEMPDAVTPPNMDNKQ